MYQTKQEESHEKNRIERFDAGSCTVSGCLPQHRIHGDHNSHCGNYRTHYTASHGSYYHTYDSQQHRNNASYGG